MSTAFFFGYGSLVNRATHDYPEATRATATGWRRAWVHTARRRYAYLSAVPAHGQKIDGLIAAVPNADWSALDIREAAYDRLPQWQGIDHAHPHATEISSYTVPDGGHLSVTDIHPILLSYLDVVVQGFLNEFGEAGATRFFTSTDGWHAPILNDRDAPIYARHQSLSKSERDFVDHMLASQGSVFV